MERVDVGVTVTVTEATAEELLELATLDELEDIEALDELDDTETLEALEELTALEELEALITLDELDELDACDEVALEEAALDTDDVELTAELVDDDEEPLLPPLQPASNNRHAVMTRPRGRAGCGLRIDMTITFTQ